MKKQILLRNQHMLLRSFLCFALLSSSQSSNAQFTQGNLVVMQLGDGSGSLTNTGNQIILKEFATTGTPAYSLAIPSTGGAALILRGNATSEGYMSKSADGNYIVFGGYAQGLPNATTLNSAASANVKRGIAVVAASGAYALAATNSITMSNGDIRGATATGSTNLWASSSSQGLGYYGNTNAASNVESTKTNLRAAHIFNGQLYISSQVASGSPSVIGVYAVGSGTPFTSSQTVTTTINTGSGSQPGQFYFNPSNTICYIADARNSALGGVQKWVYSASTWSLAYTLPTGTSAIGAFGVVADFSGANPKIYATTMDAVQNRLIAIDDIGAASTATTLAIASTSNTIFRGICFSPSTSTCIPVGITTTSNNAPVCSDQNLLLHVNASGSSPITYTWSGQGVFSSTAVAGPTVTGSSTGAYTVHVANACGTASSVISLSIYPTPVIQVNAPTICAGGIATLVASGAATYTWNTNSNSSTFTASPVTNTSYTVNGSSANGCAANSVTTTVSLTNSVNITVNSATICAGSAATLSASGASTYTWSTNSNSASLVVSPNTSTSYVVVGNASGCPNSGSATANVLVNPLPVVSVTASQTLVCIGSSSVALNGLPAGGLFSGSGVTGSGFFPTSVGNGTHAVVYQYSDANSCSNSATVIIQVDPCTGLMETSKLEAIKVYPNPSNGPFVLEFSNEQNVVIYNSLGQKVIVKQFAAGKNHLDLSTLENGMYILTAQSTGGHTSTLRLIKVTP